MKSIEQIKQDNRPDRFTLKSMASSSLVNAKSGLQSLIKLTNDEREQVRYQNLIDNIDQTIADLTKGK